MNIPSELTQKKQWCNWNNVNGTKFPQTPYGGTFRSNDPTTFATFDEAKAASDQLAFVIQGDDPYTGIDLDNCFDESGELRDWAVPIIMKLDGIGFGEVSPSGQGIKFIVRGKKTEGARSVHRFGDEKQQIEVYDFNRFWTITGNTYAGNNKVGEGQHAVDWICNEYLTTKKTEPPKVVEWEPVKHQTDKLLRASAYLATIEPAVAGSGGHNTTFRAACKLVIGFDLSPDEAFHLLWTEYNPRCSPEWSEKELRHKVESATKAPGERGELLRESSTQKSVQVNEPESNAASTPQSDTHSPVEHKPLTTPAVKILDDYARRIASDDLPQLLRLGPALDGIEVGPGLLTVPGAPPGAGKTALSSQIAFEAVDLDPELRVYIANAEMSFEALLRRQLTKITRIKSDSIRFGNLTSEQHAQVQYACDELRPKLERFGIIENPGLHSLKSLLDEPPGLVIVDYLQKFSPPDKEPRLGVNMVVTTLRELAQAGHAILALSATKRDVNGGHASKQLTLSSFKESGEVEFNADSAYVLRDEGPIDEGCQYIRKITLAHLKNRHGAKVDWELEFHMPRMEFSKREPESYSALDAYAEDDDEGQF